MPMLDPAQCIASFNTPLNMQAPCIIPTLLLKKAETILPNVTSQQIIVKLQTRFLFPNSCQLYSITADHQGKSEMM